MQQHACVFAFVLLLAGAVAFDTEAGLTANTKQGVAPQALNLVDQSAPDSDSGTPDATKCFLILTITFVVVNLVMYVVQQIKYYKGMFMPNLEQTKGEQIFFEMFNDTTLANARAALGFVPVVSLLILFILFRAENQGIDVETDSNYKAIEIGMWIVTLGLVIQAADAMLVSLRSQMVANVAETFGTLLTYTGFVFLLCGMFVVRSSIIPMSTAAKCFVALAVLLLVVMVVIKAVELKSRFAEDRAMPIDLGIVSEMLDKHRLDELQSAGSFVPVLMIAFFYLHFRYIRIGNIPDLANAGIIVSTVSVFLQAFSAMLKLFHERAGTWLRMGSMLLVYAAFGVTMYAAIDAGWPAPSLAIQVVLILLFVVAFLQLIVVCTQEFALSSLDNPADESGGTFARLTKLFKDMMSTTGYVTIVCILLLYIHFRSAFLLKLEPQEFITNMDGLPEMIYLVLFAIFGQMIIQLIELGLGPHVALSIMGTAAIAALNIGVGGIAVAAVSS